jgi:hypothetical protein
VAGESRVNECISREQPVDDCNRRGKPGRCENRRRASKGGILERVDRCRCIDECVRACLHVCFLFQQEEKLMRTLCALFALTALCAAASADVIYNFDVTGVLSMDAEGDASNQVYTIDLAAAAGLPSGTPVDMTGVGWDVTITTNGASWLSEARMYFDDVINPDGTGLFLKVGAGDDLAGSSSYSSGGMLILADYSIADIVLPDGKLRLEFFEGYDDVADSADATWDSGIVSIQYTPEPGSIALLALGGLALIRRR